MDIPQASGWAHITISKLACGVCFEKQIEIRTTDSVFDKTCNRKLWFPL